METSTFLARYSIYFIGAETIELLENLVQIIYGYSDYVQDDVADDIIHLPATLNSELLRWLEHAGQGEATNLCWHSSEHESLSQYRWVFPDVTIQVIFQFKVQAKAKNKA